MSWAVEEWHVVKGFALSDGVIVTTPDGPASLLDLSADHFITYLEALARRLHGHEQLDEMYAASAPPVSFARTEERRRQIEELEQMFGM